METTGNKIKSCLLSVQANREEFEALKIWDMDAKACFKALKGTFNTKLCARAPGAKAPKPDQDAEPPVQGQTAEAPAAD